mgnify:FL=1
MSKWLFFPSPAAGGGSDYTDYMTANSGVGYWIVPGGTAATGNANGPTGGDSSPNWTQVRFAGISNGTTAGGETMSGVTGKWSRGIQGGYYQYGNPYNYMAIGFQGAGPYYGQAMSAGWTIHGREAVTGTGQGGRQCYIPIEGTDGLCNSPYDGGSPYWNEAGSFDCIVFFMSSYTHGDVGGWTTWDGTTTP